MAMAAAVARDTNASLSPCASSSSSSHHHLLFLAAAGISFAAVSHWMRNRHFSSKTDTDAEEECSACARLIQLREEERKGRIRAERRLRAVVSSGDVGETQKGDADLETSTMSAGGAAAVDPTTDTTVQSGGEPPTSITPIGTVRSPFLRRHGCPRQGCLVPSAVSVVSLFPWVQARDALDGIDGFSHVWIVFLFDQNTNEHNRVAQQQQGQQYRQKERTASQQQTAPVKAKVRPPRLGGKKVGLFATRTPHRNNPIGLTCARIERLTAAGSELVVSGLDLVDGTRVLDVKPYVAAYDSWPAAVVPDWIEGEQNFFSAVEWTPEALEELAGAAAGVISAKSELFRDGEHIRRVVDEMLQLDPRSLNQKRRGTPDTRFSVRLHRWEVLFRVSAAAPNSGEQSAAGDTGDADTGAETRPFATVVSIREE
jgi:tRNA (adenine37-N6)-methyltransferase